MIKICLCDDIPVQLCMIEDMVRDFCDEKEYNISITTFTSGEELLDYVKNNGFFDIYVLDMIMPGIIGIDVAKELRKSGDEGKIIYLTATSEYAVDSYSVGAFFYLLKPLDRATIYKVLDRACIEVTKEKLIKTTRIHTGKTVEIKTKDGTIVISLDKLLYVNIVNRALCYHMADDTIITTPMLRIPFAEAVTEITETEGFIHAAPHLVINMGNVVRTTKSAVHFVNSEELYPPKKAFSMITLALDNMKK